MSAKFGPQYDILLPYACMFRRCTMDVIPLESVRHRLARSVLSRLAEAAPTETGRAGEPISIADLCDDRAAHMYAMALVDLFASLGALRVTDSTTVVVTSM